MPGEGHNPLYLALDENNIRLNIADSAIMK
jgi:hypothetical protein